MKKRRNTGSTRKIKADTKTKPTYRAYVITYYVKIVPALETAEFFHTFYNDGIAWTSFLPWFKIFM